MKELERMGSMIWLRKMLLSGSARELVTVSGLSTADVGRIIGVAQPNAWRYLAGQQVPRRAPALKLVELLTQLEVIDLSSEDDGGGEPRR